MRYGVIGQVYRTDPPLVESDGKFAQSGKFMNFMQHLKFTEKLNYLKVNDFTGTLPYIK